MKMPSIRILVFGLLAVLIIALFTQMQFVAVFLIIILLLLWLLNADEPTQKKIRDVWTWIGTIKYKGLEVTPREIFDEVKLTEKTKDTEPQTTGPKAKAEKVFNEGNSLLALGETVSAIKKYEEAIQIQEDFSNGFLNLGAAYIQLWHKTGDEEHLKKSIEASRKALEIAPEGYRSRINLGVALSKSRNTEEEALKYFEEANERGDQRDPLTWGKVKLFVATQIFRLAQRPGGERFRRRLPEAEKFALDSLHLFEMVPDHPEVMKWKEEADFILNMIKMP